MSKRISLITAAAAAVVLVTGAQLALASGAQQKTTTQYPASPAVGSVSRPVISGTLRAPPGIIVMTLTTAECEGLGGEVHAASSCPGTGKTCMTAGEDNVIHSTCLTHL